MKTKLTYAVLMVAAIITASCKKDEDPKTPPTVTTATPTDVTISSAKVGGEVISSGNSSITSSGIVYSKIVPEPTLAEDKKEAKVDKGAFTATLDGLPSNTLFHVRAYATNSVGTSYGKVIDFTTGNIAPVASAVGVTGAAGTGKVLTGSYTYTDAENDAQSGSTFKWYVAGDAAGAGETAISGATATTYTIQDADKGKFIRFGVTPKAGAGTPTGVEVKSSFVGPVVEGNFAPTANVTVTGQTDVGKILTATYTYSDPENDSESSSTFQWYIANDNAGAGETVIAGATSLTYTIQAADDGKFIRFGVTPKASTGKSPGVEVKSSFVKAEATIVTFTYNGNQVTYGILVSATTGRKWLDRNLGASNTPSLVTDFANYGDLFQWGRGSDGHQIITRTGTEITDMTGASTTNVQSSTDAPGHANFIAVSVSPTDWRNPQNSDLWKGVSGINNPCPPGWRIPKKDEFEAENLGTVSGGYDKLKFTLTGRRSGSSANFAQSNIGAYWTTSIDIDNNPTLVYYFRVDASQAASSFVARGQANACRCIKE